MGRQAIGRWGRMQKWVQAPVAGEGGNTCYASPFNPAPCTAPPSPVPRVRSAPVQDTFRKDANEVLIKDGPEALRYLIESAEPSPINGLYRFKDYYEDIFNFYMRVGLGACPAGGGAGGGEGRLGSGAGNGGGTGNWGGLAGEVQGRE